MIPIDAIIEALVKFFIIVGPSLVAYVVTLFMIDAYRSWRFRKDIRRRQRR